jgi:hypothetical protein
MVPPKIQLFIWLLAHNKLATVDNLNKKGLDKPVQCCFCTDHESASHLFFECVVAKAIWRFVGEFFGHEIGTDYISVASKWLQKENLYGTNIITTVVLRSVWLIWNDLIFNKQAWVVVRMVLRRMLRLTMEWQTTFKESKMGEMKRWSSFLEMLIKEPLRITNG